MATTDVPVWHTGIEESLQAFPVLLRHDECLKRNFLHLQPGLEIHITHQGQALFRAGETRLLQKHRHAVLIRGEVAHNQYIDPRWKYVRTVICIDDRRLGTLNQFGNALLESFKTFPWAGSKPYAHIVLAPPTYYRVRALCSAIDEEVRQAKQGWQTSVLGLMLQLVVELKRSVAAQDAGVPKSSAPKPELGLVQACAQYVSAHLADDLSPPAVASVFYVSREHLTRSFRREIGVSFSQYVTVRRVEEAKRLLLACPDMNVTHVADAVGFRTVQHFCRVFRNMVGETPTEYRQRHAKCPIGTAQRLV